MGLPITGSASCGGDAAGNTVPVAELSELQKQRYARHISLPELGEEGQRKLLQSKVLVIGAGGLGCPIAMYLAAAGVGTIGLVEFDTIDHSNLQRQILYATSDVGQPKLDVAERKLRDLNPDVKVVKYQGASVPITRWSGSGRTM